MESQPKTLMELAEEFFRSNKFKIKALTPNDDFGVLRLQALIP